MIRKKLCLFLCLLFLMFASSWADPENNQSENPSLIFSRMDGVELLANQYELFFSQPLNHHESAGDSFRQKIIVTHRGFDRPVVLITEGYALKHNYCAELAELLNANEIRVEHRYFGDSKPDSMQWRNLNIAQSSADYHRIIQEFRKYYTGPWISAGWSKGGQTAIFHRRFYPTDLAASVIYDSPLNFATEEPRIDTFFERVGTAEIRRKIIAFQRTILMNKSKILPLFSAISRAQNIHFSIGNEMALEFATLEYPFSFWQYHQLNIGHIPDERASAAELFAHLQKIVSIQAYADRAMNSPAMYQFCTELGYYGYVEKHLAGLLSQPGKYRNQMYAPLSETIKFNSGAMRDIRDWLEAEGNHFIFLYGGRDPWFAAGVSLAGNHDSKTYILPEGNHFTFIKNFPADTQKEIINTLKNWLE